MYLKKEKATSPSKRFKQNIELIKIFNSKPFFFLQKYKPTSGRNNTGKIVIYSKQKRLFKRWIYNNIITWTNQLGLIIDIKHIFKFKIFHLVKFKNGSISSKKAIYGLFFGDYILTSIFLTRQVKFSILGISTFLLFITKYIYINNIITKNYNKISYSKANGCYSQILDLFFDLNLVRIRLSSGKIKLLSITSLCSIGRNEKIYHKYEIFGSYTNSFKWGNKSIVRGVAMNPVDHPHGGRTKTNKPEVSPWNWVTKHSH